MDVNSIVQLITNVGFPIASWIALAWYIVKQGKDHKEETEKFTNALNENTIAINKLAEKLETK